MKLIVGIGNPGPEYSGTRHNIGFEVVDGLALLAKKAWTEEASARARIARLDPAAVLAKPTTFVNLTGDSVARLLSRYEPEGLLVVCDDVNLRLGKLRLRAEGSPGGHHGLEDITRALGAETFGRLRLGVGSDAMPGDLSGFVLERFPDSEQEQARRAVERAVEVCRVWLKEDFEAAQACLSRLQST